MDKATLTTSLWRQLPLRFKLWFILLHDKKGEYTFSEWSLNTQTQNPNNANFALLFGKNIKY